MQVVNVERPIPVDLENRLALRLRGVVHLAGKKVITARAEAVPGRLSSSSRAGHCSISLPSCASGEHCSVVGPT